MAPELPPLPIDDAPAGVPLFRAGAPPPPAVWAIFESPDVAHFTREPLIAAAAELEGKPVFMYRLVP